MRPRRPSRCSHDFWFGFVRREFRWNVDTGPKSSFLSCDVGRARSIPPSASTSGVPCSSLSSKTSLPLLRPISRPKISSMCSIAVWRITSRSRARNIQSPTWWSCPGTTRPSSAPGAPSRSGKCRSHLRTARPANRRIFCAQPRCPSIIRAQPRQFAAVCAEPATRDEGSVRSAHVLTTRFYAPIFVL